MAEVTDLDHLARDAREAAVRYGMLRAQLKELETKLEEARTEMVDARAEFHKAVVENYGVSEFGV